jgi:hypothetical protein
MACNPLSYVSWVSLVGRAYAESTGVFKEMLGRLSVWIAEAREPTLEGGSLRPSGLSEPPAILVVDLFSHLESSALLLLEP